jgi:hypothetical protein
MGIDAVIAAHLEEQLGGVARRDRMMANAGGGGAFRRPAYRGALSQESGTS